MTTPVEGNGDLRRDVRTESLLREWNIDFDFDPAVELSKVDTKNDEAQVRRLAHRAPKENVEEYATQMRHGAIFPPIVLTHNMRMVDGNTRLAACKKVGTTSFPGYIVRLPQPTYGPMLGAALNQQGGKRLTKDEAMAAAQVMFRNGMSDEAIGRTIGKSHESVRQYRKETEFEATAERTGIPKPSITTAAKVALSEIKHDAPFVKAVELASQAKLSKEDVKSLVAKINDARSEAQELEVLQAEAIKHRSVGPPPHTPAPTRAALAAGRVLDKLIVELSRRPVAEFAPASLRADLEPRYLEAQKLIGGVLHVFAEAPLELPIEQNGGGEGGSG